MTISTKELKQNRQVLIGQLAAFEGKILRGSLIESYKKCGKPGCKCATGTGHGPKHSMTVNFPKRKPENDYIPLEYVVQVKEYIENYQRFKEIIEQICMINREILKRREEL
tara:strand:+ start:242 stop:574 length:333 start_codon:yes stop_codon:yes gene_type:complete